MILRRLIKHVGDQNWVAVGLDVLVVITGIFIGLQAAFRNKMVMQRIQADVLKDIQAASDELLKAVKNYLEKTEV